jgi:hypothetical protein
MQHGSLEEVLAEQLRRAPYLISSLLIHVLIGFVLASVMLLQRPDETIPALMVHAAPPPPVVEEVKPPEPPILPPQPVDEPIVSTTDLVQADPTTEMDSGDPLQQGEAPFDGMGETGLLGIGGPPGGNHGGPPGGTKGAPPATEQALSDALAWLATHQSREGYWDADGFMLEDRWREQPSSTGKGNPVVDVGLTGLALLAFLGDGNTTSVGPYRDHVGRAVNWLRSVQRDDGLFGEEVGNPTLYNQSIATLALSEAYRLSGRSPILRAPVEKAVRLLVRARNPYGAWRYGLEPNGDNDTSLTGWMIFALKSAQDAGLTIDKGCFDGAAAWFDSMTDEHNGRTGYAWGDGGSGRGSLPSRPVHLMDKFPADKSESLTAVALLCRIFMSDAAHLRRWEDHPQHALLAKQAALISAQPPRWDEGGGLDLYYWYYATYALNQWGGAAWKNWERALGKALLPTQRRENPQDNFYGSWDPADAWGEEGGRVYSTALCALMMEVYYRYNKLLGSSLRED